MASHDPRRPAPWRPDPVPAHDAGDLGHPAPPAGAPATTAPVTYSQFYRTPRNRWWKGLISILAISVAVVVFSIVLAFGASMADLLLGNTTTEELATGQITMTPLLLLATNLTLIAAAVVAVLLHRYLHRQPVGTLHSVVGRFRWDWFGRAAVVVVPLFVVYVVVLVLLEPPGPVLLNATAWAFLAVVLTTTPLQAVSEEYLFRGVIQRAAGSWAAGAVPSLVVGTLVSAVMFSLAHFATDVWLIAYYLVFGIAMSLLTHATGGLEAAALVHASNNVVMFLVSASTGLMSQGFDRSAGVGGPFMLAPMFVLATIAVIMTVLARRRGLSRRAVPPATA